MDRFLCIQAFVRVAESHSFANAARQLGVSPSVITHRIKQLETFVETPLFHRSTRTVTLSEAGTRFFDECAELVTRIDSMTDRMRLAQGTPSGILRVQVLPGFAIGHLGRAIKDFSAAYPDINIDMTVSDKPANPVDEGYDVAFEIFRSGSEMLIERPLFPIRRLFCASPQYLKKAGAPQRPADLLRHSLGVYSGYPTRNRWNFRRGEEEVDIELPARIRSNSVHLLHDFAMTGGGITCLPTLVCSRDILLRKLVPLLTEYQLPPLELLAIYPTTQRGAVKVRLLVEFITERFSGEPEWDQTLRNFFPPSAQSRVSASRSLRSVATKKPVAR
ncbi:MAG TPA: LysR family transcriptional regulator [Steroidobacteraceae bacterium]